MTWGWHRGLCSALPGSRRSFRSWVGQGSTATIQSRAQGLWVPQGPCRLGGLVHLLSGLCAPQARAGWFSPRPCGRAP